MYEVGIGLLVIAVALAIGYWIGRSMLGEYAGPWLFLAMFGLYASIAVLGLLALAGLIAWGLGRCLLVTS